ncbi:hypothetical protein M0657_002011 [Pyricularia oryzae]|nr:hypothetical protein M0657_002011 [Pyricularia oryzae]
MASSQTDDMQWAPSPVHHFDRLPSMDVDYGTHRSTHMQSDSSFASTGLQHPPISTNSSGSGGGGCPYAQNSLRFPRSQAPHLISSTSSSSSSSSSSSTSSSASAAAAAAATNANQSQQQSSNLDFLCRPSSLFVGSNVRNSPLPDPLGLSYRGHVPSNLGNSSANNSASNNSSNNNGNNTPYDPVHHSLSSPSRLTQQQQQPQPPPPPTTQQQQHPQQQNNQHTHNHHPHYDRHQVVLPNHPSTFPWGPRTSLPPHPRSGSMSGVFCPPQLPPPPPLTSDPWASGNLGRGNSLGHPYQHMMPQGAHYMSTPNQPHFWHQQGSQSQRAVHFSPPSTSSRTSLSLASLPPLAPRNMASNSAASSSTAADAASTAPHMYASPVSSPSSSISSIATSPPSRDQRDIRHVPRDQTPDAQSMAQQSQSAARESTANGAEAPAAAGSPQRRPRPESGISNSSPVDSSQGALAEDEEHLDMPMSDEDHDYSDGDSNDSHLQDMYVQQLGATAAMAQANREAGRREELEARREERIRQQQLFRGAMTNKRIASRTAISSMESVDIASLPELERTCVICYNDFGVPSPEGISEAPLRLPKCKHVFGDHCIKKWLQDSDTCPYCRDKLPSESVVSVNNRSLNAYLGMNGGPPDPSWFQSDHDAVNLTHDAFVRLYGRQIVSNNSSAASRAAAISNRRPPPPEEQAELRHRRRSRYAAPINNRRGQAILSAHIGEPTASGTRNEIPRSNSLSGASDPSASQRPMSALHSMNHIPQEWQRLHYSSARSSSSNTATGGQMSTSQPNEAGATSSDGNASGSTSGLGAPEPTSDEAYFGTGGPFSQQLPQLPRLDIRGLVGSSSVSPAYQFWDLHGSR